MDGDLLQLIIYIAIGLVGVIASAYKNKKRANQRGMPPPFSTEPRTIAADPQKDFAPDLGPLMELFDIPKSRPYPEAYETVERGPSVEEAGMAVDSEESSAELAGTFVDKAESELDKPLVDDASSFEEGQSDIQKMIAKYEAIRKELDNTDAADDIASGEIVSVEAEEAARAKSENHERFFELRKAIIYSEILKRKEY